MTAIIKHNRSARIDLTRRYALLPGARVIARGPDAVQIGTDPPRSVVLHRAPRESLGILNRLDGGRSAGEVLSDHDADPLVWNDVLARLLAADLLVDMAVDADVWTAPAGGSGHLSAERTALAHRHGPGAAARMLQARDDALVVVLGSSPVAVGIATGLAAAGVGHIHHQPDRVVVPPLTAPAAAIITASVSWTANALRVRGATALRDTTAVAALLRQVSASVRVHAPAAHQCPTLVVLAGRSPPDLGVAAALSRDRIPHLAVHAGAVRAVVGPLVLPGRSSCLSCAHRHRTDADPGWPTVARTVTDHEIDAPAFLAAAAAALAVGQILDHLDGAACPAAVDGTLEWSCGDTAARRRTWPVHPDCGCHA